VTTDSDHSRRGYLNLKPEMELGGINHLSVGGNHLRSLTEGIVFISVVIEAFSPRVIGGALDRTLQSEPSQAGRAPAF
jgi:hypothetical protein